MMAVRIRLPFASHDTSATENTEDIATEDTEDLATEDTEDTEGCWPQKPQKPQKPRKRFCILVTGGTRETSGR
jgi:hypothetical protein